MLNYSCTVKVPFKYEKIKCFLMQLSSISTMEVFDLKVPKSDLAFGNV